MTQEQLQRIILTLRERYKAEAIAARKNTHNVMGDARRTIVNLCNEASVEAKLDALVELEELMEEQT
jgi:hypothetical protein